MQKPYRNRIENRGREEKQKYRGPTHQRKFAECRLFDCYLQSVLYNGDLRRHFPFMQSARKGLRYINNTDETYSTTKKIRFHSVKTSR